MKHYLTTKDHFLTQERFELWHHPEMDYLETRPVPEHIEKYYQSDDYISHGTSKKTFFTVLYSWAKSLNLRSKYNLIKKLHPTAKTICDIGTGTGDFLHYLQEKGFEVYGTEPNEKARTTATNKGISVCEHLGQLPRQQFDMITLWHVLEHLPDLDQSISNITSLLEANGKLLVAVPNYKSYDAQYYKHYWAAYDTPRHLWHFSRNSIEAIFRKHRMKIETTKGMPLDAFYVSLLSEKYKNGHHRYFSAFIIALLSNIQAIQSKEHSSRIYVLRKT
ncbi:class I SAM-dependent methyltransferase [Maribacter sp. 2307ULW6-5]|uniref:class I SAM-dependent methyltransferase n=1 Tax=Maribacter sp. 2307ULW6-5 TaxID=3386275 RepID=UPI0039BC9E7C